MVGAIPALGWSAPAGGSADFFDRRRLDSMASRLNGRVIVALHRDDLVGLVDHRRSILASIASHGGRIWAIVAKAFHMFINIIIMVRPSGTLHPVF